MKITVSQSELARALALLAKVVDRKSTIPILEHVVFSAGADVVSVRGTDMDIEALVTLAGAEIAEPGEITAPAAALHEIARALRRDAPVSLESEGIGHLAIRCGASQFKLPVLRPDDYPVLRVDDISHRFALSAETLRILIDRTHFAISTEETRYYLNGIYLHAKSDDAPVIRAVAADTHRLARFEASAPEGADGMPGVIVPTMTVDTVRSMIGGCEGDVAVAVGVNRIQFSVPGIILTSKLIDGTYPDYERAIPQGNDRIAVVARDALAEAVKKMKPISKQLFGAVKLLFSEDGLTVSTCGEDGAEAVDQIDCQWQGPEMLIGANNKYISENIEALTGDMVRLAFRDPGSPMVISDPDDSRFLYVLMPMRV